MKPGIPRPVTLVTAITIMLVGIIISIPVAFLNISSIPIEEAGVGAPAALTGYFVAASIQLIFIYLIFSGRNWARYIYVVLLLLGIILGLDGPNTVSVYHQSSVFNHWIQMVLNVVVLVLLLVPATTAWFKELKIHKLSQ